MCFGIVFCYVLTLGNMTSLTTRSSLPGLLNRCFKDREQLEVPWLAQSLKQNTRG